MVLYQALYSWPSNTGAFNQVINVLPVIQESRILLRIYSYTCFNAVCGVRYDPRGSQDKFMEGWLALSTHIDKSLSLR